MLPVRFRLSGRDSFESVFREGYYGTHRSFGLKWRKNGLGTTRIGFSAGKKLFPTAAGRNRAKRFAREAVRAHLPRLLSGYDIVILYRYPPDRFVFKEGAGQIGILLERHNLLKHT
jgi:ribonuclease P protein component